jgi:hypothetical protein
MTVTFGLKQLLSLLLITEAATLVPPDPKPVLSLTTATNWDVDGYLSWKLVVVELPSNC